MKRIGIGWKLKGNLGLSNSTIYLVYIVGFAIHWTFDGIRFLVERHVMKDCLL